MVSRSGGSPHWSSSAGKSLINTPATTAPHSDVTPPISAAASRTMFALVGNCTMYSRPTSPASRPPATPVANDASASAQSL